MFPKEVKKLANFIVNKVNDIPTLIGKNPNSLAAASIFLASDLTGNGGLRSGEEIGAICGAAENTIKQTVKIMQQHQDKLLPPDFKPIPSSSAASTSKKIESI